MPYKKLISEGQRCDEEISMNIDVLPAFSCFLLLSTPQVTMRPLILALLCLVGRSVVCQVLDDRYDLDESLSEAGEIVVWGPPDTNRGPPDTKTEKKTEPKANTDTKTDEEEDRPPASDDANQKNRIASSIEETATAVAQWISVAIFLVGLVAGIVRVAVKLRENPGEFLEILQDFRLSLARHAANARNRFHR